MAKKILLTGVNAHELSLFSETLKIYLKLHNDLARFWNRKDAVWWDIERANLGVFAAAIWRSNGMALEEYSRQKSIDHQRVRTGRESYTGRNDLLVWLKNRQFVIESKRMISHGGPTRRDIVSDMNENLDRAVADAKRNRVRGQEKLAILFVSPGFKYQFRKELNQYIVRWIQDLFKVRCSALAWSFPTWARHAIQGKYELFPGHAVLIKRVK